jgi:hypothetical protein
VLVLHRIRRFPVEFDQIGPTGKPQSGRPEVKSSFYPYATGDHPLRLIHPLMQGISPQGIDVFVIGLLPVDQRALSGTVTIVFQGRDHDGIIFGRD